MTNKTFMSMVSDYGANPTQEGFDAIYARYLDDCRAAASPAGVGVEPPLPQAHVAGDGEAAIIECLSAGEPFVFDPATNFLHADDGTVEGGIRYAPAPSSHVAVTEAAKRYLAAIDSDPENDIWDTWDGKPAEGALKTASDASWADHGQKIEARLSELRTALATTEGQL